MSEAPERRADTAEDDLHGQRWLTPGNHAKRSSLETLQLSKLVGVRHLPPETPDRTAGVCNETVILLKPTGIKVN